MRARPSATWDYSPRELAQLWEFGGVRHGQVTDPAAGALLTPVRVQTGNLGTVEDETWRAALDTGWTDVELTETSAHVALTLFTNYVNHLVQTDLDLPSGPALCRTRRRRPLDTPAHRQCRAHQSPTEEHT